MPNPIPSSQRAAVALRDGHRCLRCGGVGYHLHHRRGRSVKDDHTHCTCNLVTLCGHCHDFAHSHERDRAVGHGWIVSRAVSQPGVALVYTAQYNWVSLTCEGTMELRERTDDA